MRPRDIADWCAMTGTPIRREEMRILTEMDAAYRTATARERAEEFERIRADAETKAKR
jgi:hypothetical protein